MTRSYNVYYKLIYIYFLLKPIYLFKSGVPQVSDFIMLLILLYSILRKDISKISLNNQFVMFNIYFGMYVFVVNSIATIYYGELGIFKSSIWHIYNVVVCIFMVGIGDILKDKFYKVVFNANFTSLIIQVIVLIIKYDPSLYRQIGMFNNPNQLGYYSIVSVALVLLSTVRIKENLKFKEFKVIVSIISSLILSIASSSKAAIVSVLLLVIIFLISNRKKYKIYILCATIIISIGLISIESRIGVENIPVISNTISRFQNKQSDDTLEGRYYNRIWEYPQYLIFGSGEGYYSRFDIDAEMHSTLGNILMSYGIIGFSIFCVILIIPLVKTFTFEGIYVMLPIMLYGITHNGVRNTLVWILLALIYKY